MEEPQPSLTRNLTGGGGCGCGCVGLLAALAGAMVLSAIGLGMFLDPSAAPYGVGLSLVIGGLLVAGIGAVVWVVSLFMD